MAVRKAWDADDILRMAMKAEEQERGWPAGGGECGRVMREKDWSVHPMGAVEDWPPVLRAMADTILCCSFPLIVLWGRDLFQIYNDPYMKIMGPRHPAGMGQKTAECWPEAWKFNRRIYERVFLGETVDFNNHRLPLLRDGRLEDYYFDLCYSPLRSAEGEIAGVLVAVFDVTQRYNAEKAQQLSNRRLNALVAATSYSTYLMNADWSEMRELEGGGFLADTHGRNRNWLQQYIHPDDQATVLRTVAEAITEKKMFELEHRVRRADGSLGWTLSRAVPIHGEDGRISEWFGAASDVTARKLAERALLENEKLAVVGRLASSIAHEINNPLAAVTNLIYLAQSSAGDAETRRHLEQASAELERVNHIAAATLRFHRQSATPTAVNLSEVLDSVLILHQGRIAAQGIELEKRFERDVRITCWPNEVRQVVANIVANAIDAMEQSAERKLVVRSRAVGNDGHRGAVVLISDNGAGVPDGARRRLYEPFFTTKETTGTGLGLWVSRNIVQRHGGAIRLRSSEGGRYSGTVFSVFFPAAPVT